MTLALADQSALLGGFAHASSSDAVCACTDTPPADSVANATATAIPSGARNIHKVFRARIDAPIRHCSLYLMAEARDERKEKSRRPQRRRSVVDEAISITTA
jgi:hypothetical protein